MIRKIPAMACLLLVATTGLTACYDHPGRNRPPHGGHHGGHHDDDHGRPGGPGGPGPN